MRSGNPALSSKTFETLRVPLSERANAMTVSGTVNKCFLLLFLVLLGASFTWRMALGEAHSGVIPWMMGGLLIGFIFAMVTVFKKEWAPYTSPIYALAEGLALGGISAIYENQYPGIVIQAVGLTFATLFCLLMAYKSGLIKVTENFRLGIVAATGAICLVYLANFVMGFFGVQMPYLHDSGPIGIGISVVIVIVAALNLVLDFDFIESGAEQGAPKYMEWYGAFGLIVTLVWLYLEMIRLLSKARR